MIICFATGALMTAFITAVAMNAGRLYTAWEIFWIDVATAAVMAIGTSRALGELRKRDCSSKILRLDPVTDDGDSNRRVVGAGLSRSTEQRPEDRRFSLDLSRVRRPVLRGL